MTTRTIEYIKSMSTGGIKLILDTDPTLPVLLEVLLLQELANRSKDSVNSDDK